MTTPSQLAAHPSFWSRPWLKTVTVLGTFFLVGVPFSAGLKGAAPDSAWLPPTGLKLLMLAAAIGATLAQQQTLRDIGFRSQRIGLMRRAIGAGLLIGAAGSLVMLVSGAQGLRPAIKQLTFGQIVVTVWLLSSFAEEVLCRGWFQTWLLGPQHEGATWSQLAPSAVLFGAMHLGVLLNGVDLLSVALLLPMVTGLGFVTAWARARTSSIGPAVAAHIAFNIGGVVSGIAYRLITGHLPG